MGQIETSPHTASSSACASVTSVAISRYDGGRAMKFLLKVAFWLSIVVMLLPSAEQPSTKTNLSAGEALGAASAAVADMRQFCARQPEACEVGAQAVTTFGQKAQAGAKMLYEYLTEKFGQDRTGSIGGARSAPSQHTLTPADLSPAWRGAAKG